MTATPPLPRRHLRQGLDRFLRSFNGTKPIRLAELVSLGTLFATFFGTFVSTILNLADLFSARRLFAVSAIAAGAFNLLVIPVDGFG